MHEFDTTLKLLIQQFGKRTLERLTGTTIARWLPTELPNVQNLRVDLLGENAEGKLMQLEIQSTNDRRMPMRMLEYAVAIARSHQRFPQQLVLYVGREPMRMEAEIQWESGFARYELIDMRELDAEPFLASSEPSDNVMAILAKLSDQREALRLILKRLSGLPESQRRTYMQALLTLAGLRGLSRLVQEEGRKVPFTINILENEVLGPVYSRGLQDGREEGREAGRREGELTLLRELIVRRFGSLPAWANEALSNKSAAEITQLGIGLLDAKSLEDLLR